MREESKAIAAVIVVSLLVREEQLCMYTICATRLRRALSWYLKAQFAFRRLCLGRHIGTNSVVFGLFQWTFWPQSPLLVCHVPI
ncbi:hypothetical protein BAUCODRAFT_354125 [Baudoinia panamericana UAMH 10762]|uniref:Uncharacterized protein n=1 Tax=Baudoinia panamericana (strain UAMH 10762) TaxID=717646 RepID=M2MSN5_BAUPA|nr:uncharacterized protein BAUCODRAFT_354125 [Baudoinia panamericana UAMH 10762]EMC99891.1 hypothetical protein BAUCODRAFT_354125 [Baudoinia panamericana UAMH 10762]